jgi:hypothetical protein
MYSGLCLGLEVLLSGVLLSAPAEARYRHYHHHLHQSESVGFAEVPRSNQFGGPEGWTTYVDRAAGTRDAVPPSSASKRPARLRSQEDRRVGQVKSGALRILPRMPPTLRSRSGPHSRG